MEVRPLDIAVVSTNNPTDYSGGRYHGLMLAFAAAAGGAHVRYLTDRRPVFLADLAGLAPGRVGIEIVEDWRSDMADGPLDYVVVVPTGVFHPAFYAAALGLAAGSGARLVLVNFESADWFNVSSPVPRDPALWQSWRGVVAEGGLVLSSARVSHDRARSFYRAPAGRLRFEIWSPPINAPAARAADGMAKARRVVTFLRSIDPHKGGADLLRLDPAALGGRRLDIVSGGEVDPAVAAALRARFDPADSGRLAFHVRLGDEAKFRLLAAADALVFPSHFEGFGYPPVEAAFAGTEIAAYDLPVLRETVGTIAHLAPLGDAEALGDALRTALATPPRPAALRAAVAHRVGFEAASVRLIDLLWRNREALAPRPHRRCWVEIGPQAGTPPKHFDAVDPTAPAEPLPPIVTSCRLATAGDLLLAMVLETATPVETVTPEPGTALTAPALILPDRATRDPTRSRLLLALPAEAIGRTVTLTLGLAGGATSRLEFMIVRADPTALAAPPVLIPTGWRQRGAGVELTLRLDPPFGIDTVMAAWEKDQTAAATPVAGAVRVTLPANIQPDAPASWFLWRAADWVDLLDGYPPSATARPARRVPSDAGAPVTLAVLGQSDASWRDGVARRPVPPHLGTIRVGQPADIVTPGRRIRLGSGRIRRIAAIEQQGDALDLHFALPVSPALDGYPGAVTLLPDAPEAVEMVLVPRTDEAWSGGIWCFGPERARSGLLLAAGPAALAPGMTLALGADETRRIIGLQPDPDGMVVWLDAPVPAETDAAALRPRLVPPKAAPVQVVEALSDRRIRLAAGPDPTVGRGGVLRFPDGATRRIVAASVQAEGVEVTLDLAAPEGSVVIVDAVADRCDGPRPTLRHPTPHRPSALVDRLIDAARADGHDLPLPALVPAEDRPRILFCTLVPMTPVDQGNRAVTFRFVAHLVDLGFDVDVVLQGTEIPGEFSSYFGERVRVVSTPFPDWLAAPGVAERREVLDAVARGTTEPSLQAVRRAARYHPYFIVADAAVELAIGLYRRHGYRAVVCNYTHMVRIARELETVRPLPPVVVITHDALSRLEPGIVGGLDTMFRYCPPEWERDVLNAVAGATILAISEDERQYFEAIGVELPVVLCEYDALAELAGLAIPETAWESATLVFHASGNALNRAALDWFVEFCWPAVIAAVPAARLVVCGRVGETWTGHAAGVERAGPLDRPALIERLRGAAIAINPSAAGTGLKIKTIEALALGLPSVCRPAAVQGLESVADRFALVAEDPTGFARACIRLLTDADHWRRLRSDALELAEDRFASGPVYRALDQAMGWQTGIGARRLHPRRPRAPAQPALPAPTVPPPGRTAEPAVLLAVGIALAGIGESEAARPLVEKAASGPANGIGASLPAGRLALDRGESWLAAQHGAAAVAADPIDPAGYRLIAEALRACGDGEAALDAATRALHAGPADPASLALFVALAPSAPAARLRPFLAEPFDLAVGETRRFVPAQGGAGFGWAYPESWGCWTAHRQARLVLRAGNATGRPLLAQLHLQATDDGTATDQIVDVFVDGVAAGVLRVPRDDTGRIYAVPIRADGFAATGLVTIDLWIQAPAVKRKAGRIVDPRRLGVALSSIGLIAVEPKPGGRA